MQERGETWKHCLVIGLLQVCPLLVSNMILYGGG